MWNFIKNLDQFGVAYQPKIHYTTAEYKTIQGGIMSVLLYGLSFSYLLYLFIQWQQGSILPKITTLQNVEQNYKLEFLDKYVEMELRKYIYTDIDPFNPDAIILQPVVYYFINGQAPQTGFPQNMTKNLNSFGFNRLELKNLTTQISEDQTNENPLIEMMLVLGQCQTYYLSEGQKCADYETITKFFDQKTNTLIVKLQKQEFNTNSEELESINKEMIVPLQKASSFYAQINVKVQNAQVDTGFLFESFDDYDFITDYQITGSMMDKEYFQKVLQYEAYAVLYYKIDQIQLLSQIVFPKISEVLADAGSIASTLLLLSYLMIMLNSSYQEFETVNHIIGMYYPEFKNVKIIKNVFGKIIRVENQGKLVNLETFLPYFEKLRNIGQVKLTISNQIYELSRIQFILQYLHSRKFLLQFHKAGIPLQIFQYEQINSKDENQSKVDNSFVHQDQQYKSNQIIPNVESQDFKFKQSNNQSRKELAIEIAKQDQNTDKTHNSQINEVEMIEQYYREGDFDLLSYPQDDDNKLQQQKEQNNNSIKEQQLKQDATNIDLLQQVQNE